MRTTGIGYWVLGVGHTVAALVTLLLLSCAMLIQAAPLPEGWGVSPHNSKSEGQAGYCIQHKDTGMELLWVPAATFVMGTTEAEAQRAAKEFGAYPERLAAEQPAHEVQLNGYWIGRTEVTAGQWRKVMGKMPPPEDVLKRDRNSNGEDHPVTWFTVDEALEFCSKLGLRLPTEAEWEYAARGPERRVFPWGDKWDEKKCSNGKHQYWVNGVGFRTHPVGSFPEGASWCGALDMAGNLWEWCVDWFDGEYYSKSPKLNPQGAKEGGSWKLRAARGGSYGSDGPNNFRTSYRVTGGSDSRQMGYGFRCAK